MPRLYVGTSEFQGLAGRAQYLEERAALQLLAVLAIVNPQLPAAERVTINEGERPRASQTAFWNDYVRRGAPPAVVAARPFTSKHDGGPNGDSARAADLGGPGGRVISDRAHALVKAVGAEYGIHHTGAGFRPPEKWHFEYVPGTARKLASAGPTEQEQQEEEHMTANIYRDSKTGDMRTIDVSTGRDTYLAPGYPDLEARLKMAAATVINVPPNEMAYLRQRAEEVRKAAAAESAAAVWGAVVVGYNGQQTAAARLAGIDEKAGKATVDASGLTVKVDEASLVAKITTALDTVVRSAFTRGGTK